MRLRSFAAGSNCNSMSGYDIRIHTGEKTRVHHTQGAYRLPPGLEPGDEVVLERFQPGYWTVRNCEGRRVLVSMTCVGDTGMLGLPKSRRPGCKTRVRVPQGSDFPDLT